MAINLKDTVQIIRGRKADIAQRTGTNGELNWAEDTFELFIHDGKTKGGHYIGGVSGTVKAGNGITVTDSSSGQTVAVKPDSASVVYATSDGVGVRLGNSGAMQITSKGLDLRLASGGGLVVDANGLKVDSQVLSSVFRYAGQVDSIDDLPADAAPGDVYDVRDSGANYVWTGTQWDNLGGILSVDSVPTQGSTNPVASGGVYDAIENAKLNGDGYTVSIADKNITAHDVAVDGDTSDLASDRGQIGDAVYQAAKDFHTYTKSGVYFLSGVDTAANHPPYGTNGVLVVYASKTGHVEHVFHRIGTPGANDYQIFTETYAVANDEWSDWHTVLTSENVGNGLKMVNNMRLDADYTSIYKTGIDFNDLIEPGRYIVSTNTPNQNAPSSNNLYVEVHENPNFGVVQIAYDLGSSTEVGTFVRRKTASGGNWIPWSYTVDAGIRFVDNDGNLTAAVKENRTDKSFSLYKVIADGDNKSIGIITTASSYGAATADDTYCAATTTRATPAVNEIITYSWVNANVVRITGDQTISGTKIFTNNLQVQKSHAVIRLIDDSRAYDEVPSAATSHGAYTFNAGGSGDGNNRVGYIRLWAHDDGKRILALKTRAIGKTAASDFKGIEVVVPQTGDAYVTVPNTRDTPAANEVITYDYLSSHAVMTTGNQTVAGEKTFTGSPIIRASQSPNLKLVNTGMNLGEDPSSNRYWIVAFRDADNTTTMGDILFYHNTESVGGNQGISLRLLNNDEGEISPNYSLALVYDHTAKKFVATAPTTAPDLHERAIVTYDWLTDNAVMTTGNQTISGTKTFTNVIVFKTAGSATLNAFLQNITKGTSPSATLYVSYFGYDKSNSLAQQNRLFGLEMGVSSDRTSASLYTYKNQKGVTTRTGIQVFYPNSGDPYSTAPLTRSTPANNEIITYSFLNANYARKSDIPDTSSLQSQINNAAGICSGVAMWGRDSGDGFDNTYAVGLTSDMRLPNYGTWRVNSTYPDHWRPRDVAGGTSISNVGATTTRYGLAIRIA